MQECDTLLPSRLSGAELQEQVPFSLLVRPSERSADTYRVIMNAKGLQLAAGAITFMTTLLNKDFQPALQPITSNIRSDNMWTGGLCMVTNGNSVPTETGFIMPYEDAIDRSLLDFFETIGTSR